MKRNRTWIVPVLALLVACGGDDGEGTVAVKISGQGFAKTGWPADEGGERVEFTDGWQVRFKHVIVSAHGLRLREGGEELIASAPANYLIDLQAADYPLWTIDGVAAQRWTDVGYRFAAPAADAMVLGTVPNEVVEKMKAERLSLWLEGSATKADRTLTFAFAIPGEVIVSNCLNGLDETDGIVVSDGRTTEVEITLHMDHLFWDDHDAEEPRLLFGPMAFAAGADNHVTLEDLAAQRLTDLRDETGAPLVDETGVPIVYVPREPLRDNNLREYLIDTAITIGHFNGEGHCSYQVNL
jgi:hypothetical protein